ncbi:MAG: mechanosensitive ion channel family protein [Aphanocapsa sp. GSE-SYN-MK-11-07L]|jgi:small conductance mechanosensitive channel|nr:mechanosensitive ion channel family protein [Aphanocapsa sp. GSE-SYN-MK-11-07L]
MKHRIPNVSLLHRHRIIRWVLLGVFALALSLSWATVSWGQFSLPTTPGQTPPDHVTRYGALEVAWVKSPLDSKDLFQIAAPTVADRTSIGEATPVEARANLITANLNRAVETFKDPGSLKVETTTLNKLTVLTATDKDSSRPLRLMTVTNDDSDFHLKTINELATEWQKILQADLVRNLDLLSEESQSRGRQQALLAIAVILAVSVIGWLIEGRLRRWQQSLQSQLAESKAATNHEPLVEAEPVVPPTNAAGTVQAQWERFAAMRSQFISNLRQQSAVQRKLNLVRLLRWLLFWSVVIICYFSIWSIVTSLPSLRPYQRWIVGTPIDILIALFMISLGTRLCDELIDRAITTWHQNAFFSIRDTQRKGVRASTISSALKGLFKTLIIIAVVLWLLNKMEVSTGSILAGGAILGLAISFGSQSLIKDVVNGFLILVEDQFAVGDVVKLANASGLVENLNLRVTQLRNSEGRLITVPNSAITQVENLTRHWSRVDLGIEVPYLADVQVALGILKDVGNQLYTEPAWRDRILESPEVLGVDDLALTGTLLRVWIKTAPLQQWKVAREFRYRVRLAFQEHGMIIPPQA